jgi:hypothetical protein
MLLIRATPIELVRAPGAGRAIMVDKVDFLLSAASGAYTETADNLAVEYSGGADILTVEATGFLDQASAEPRTVERAEALVEPVVNQSVQLINNGDGEFGGGNAATFLEVVTHYRLVNGA